MYAQMSRLNIDRASISTLSVQALQQPTQFNATERSAFIRSSVKQIREMNTNGYDTETIKSIFPEFAEQYPGLLAMVLRPGGFDEKSLGLMINMLDKMGASQTTQHEASIKVGQHLFDSYVNPQLDSLGPTGPDAKNQTQ
jgi:hypothetical protein